MDKSAYPNQVVVRTGDLQYSEAQRAEHILKRFIAADTPGITHGLVVSNSATGNNFFDLLAGDGFALNGELVELATTLENQTVGSPAALTLLLIGLMYQEQAIKRGASASDGTARPRRVVRASALRVFTAEQWVALPETYPQDLTIDAQDRFLCCAVAQVPGTPGPLILTLPPTFETIKTCTQPSNITGLVVQDISNGTRNSNPFPTPGAVSTGALVFDTATLGVTWRSPFDTAAGATVTISNTVSALYAVFSNNGDSLVFFADPTALPSATVGATVTDNLTVASLYAVTADRTSAADQRHRNLLGGQKPSATNPHGNTLAGIARLLELLGGGLSLGNAWTAILGQAENWRLQFAPNTQVNTGPTFLSRYQQLIETPGAWLDTGVKPRAWRVYRSGTDSVVLVLNARVVNQGANALWSRNATAPDNCDPNEISLKLVINSAAIALYSRAVGGAATWTDVDWQTRFFFNNQTNATTTYSPLTLSGTAGLRLDQTLGRFQWLTPKTMVKSMPGAAAFFTTASTSITIASVGSGPYRRYLKKTGVTAGAAFWPIALPNGATIVSARVDATVATGVNDVSITSIDATGAIAYVSPIVTLVTGGTFTVASAPTVIDNTTTSFYVDISSASGSTYEIERVDVTYTLDEVQTG